eukprot:GCRY01000410.1.p1 GENE.GCRY01000410.1~~GCRY01000410.1.p1  ORF type:complete len:799 (+),score=281.68 GCRY01000410.1:122-2518(+)
MSHPEFSSEGPYGQQLGIEIWRIENMLPKRVDKKDFGTFYTGDSYILLHTKKQGTALVHDIHFWLGKESTKDEIGAAALKTVELDDSLGGEPVQYREVQEHESQKFLTLFKGGVSYVEGGVDSAFKKVERDVYRKRLLHCKGKKAVRVTEVEPVCSSLNKGDVFILDCGLKIYQWNGPEANRMEKAKGLDVALKIRDQERGGRAEIVIVEDDTEDFWTELGGKGKVAEADEAGSDEQFEKSSKEALKLFRVCDESGTLEVTQVGSHPLTKEMLDTNDCFIVSDQTEIFVWVGKGATKQEKTEAMKHAQTFLEQQNLPMWTPITRVIEGGETPLFKEKFKWPVEVPAHKLQGEKEYVKKEDKAVDVSTMHMSKMSIDEGPDDGTGSLKVWRIVNFEKVEVPKEQHGQLWAGDSFIHLYTYMKGTREQYILYFWQGKDSTADERGASALLTTQIDDELGGAAVQVRCVQNKEPPHFLKLFNGRLIIHSGGCPSGFASGKGEDDWEYETEGLFRVRGTTPAATRATEIPVDAANLNSNDAFVLNLGDKQWVWIGKGASAEEKESAVVVAKTINDNRTSTLMIEGEEEEAFWTALGGKKEYANDPALQDEEREPRLFQGSNATGSFRVEEIFNFDQDDLDKDDCFILDTFNEVTVWVGAGSNETEKKMAMETAINYVKEAKDGRDPDCPILVVQQGNEPTMFTAYFPEWDVEKARSGEDPYARKLRELGQAGPVKAEAALNDYSRKYTYKELLERPAQCDKTQLELYLEDDEFATVFGMSRADYEKMPKWKKQNLKKKVNLF